MPDYETTYHPQVHAIDLIPFPELNIAKVCAEFFNYAMISSQ